MLTPSKFPSVVNDESITVNGIVSNDVSGPQPKRVSRHVFRYRQIQSEMQATLYEKPPAVCAPEDIHVWQQRMHGQIQSWYDDTPRSASLTDSERKNLENFELTYHRAMFYLYHPSANVASPPESALLSLTEAASQMIRLYRRFFTEHRLTIFWQAVENLYSAGTGLLYSYVNSSQVRERIAFRELESLVHTCSSVLWGMVEHFPDFKGKRDAFDLVASSTLADLTTEPMVTGQIGRSPEQTDNVTGRQREHFTAAEYANSTVSQGQQQPIFQATQAGQPGFAATESRVGRWTQRLESQVPLATCMESDEYEPHAAFSFSDFDDVSFDWDAFENNNDFIAPSWL